MTEIGQGRSNTEIAAHRVLSQATVKTHVNHLRAKASCRDRAALVVYAYRTGRAAISSPRHEISRLRLTWQRVPGRTSGCYCPSQE